MQRADFIETVQRKVAVSAIVPSAMRGQGKGMVASAQGFLASLPLTRIPASHAGRFRDWLDHQTETLVKRLPTTPRRWGAARKALNLFLRDSLYNQYLSQNFGLSRVEPWLEIPLDGAVARGLKAAAGRGVLPAWPGVKHLTCDISDEYQRFASERARSLGLDRVHLDIYLWLQNR